MIELFKGIEEDRNNKGINGDGQQGQKEKVVILNQENPTNQD